MMCNVIQIPTSANFRAHFYDEGRRVVILRLREVVRLMAYCSDDEQLAALICEAATLTTTIGSIEQVGEYGRTRLAAMGIR